MIGNAELIEIRILDVLLKEILYKPEVAVLICYHDTVHGLLLFAFFHLLMHLLHSQEPINPC